ncbi:hypothetical protein AAFN47_18080 [Hoeflea sp. CAU 1731]
MNSPTPLTPAKVLASRNKSRFPYESQAYREARNACWPTRSNCGGNSNA